MRRHPGENHTPAGERLAWLTEYAVRYRYPGAAVLLHDRSELLEAVTGTVTAIIDRIHMLTATEEKLPVFRPGQTNSHHTWSQAL